MGVCTRLLQRKHCWTMKGSLLALTLLVGLWSIIIASSGESSNGGELKNVENNADVLSRTIREAERNGKKLKAKKGEKRESKKEENRKKAIKESQTPKGKRKREPGKRKKAEKAGKREEK